MNESAAFFAGNAYAGWELSWFCQMKLLADGRVGPSTSGGAAPCSYSLSGKLKEGPALGMLDMYGKLPVSLPSVFRMTDVAGELGHLHRGRSGMFGWRFTASWLPLHGIRLIAIQCLRGAQSPPAPLQHRVRADRRPGGDRTHVHLPHRVRLVSHEA